MKSNLHNNKLVFVSDFDGTISKRDFFAYVTQEILTPSDMKPWYEYKSGLITHVEALNRIFNKIRMSVQDFDKFIDTIEIEEYFEKTVFFCNDNQIDFYVVSAGADYYINRILGNLNLLDKVEIITNPSKYSQDRGLELFPVDKSHELYDLDLGISKKSFVQNLQAEGYKVIFAGDGMPDIAAASVADIVFAKDYLIELCEKDNLKYNKFMSYQDIYNFLKTVIN